MQTCPLCDALAAHFAAVGERHYYRCEQCTGIFLRSDCRLDAASEKERYLAHNNDPNDSGYRQFVAPITDHVLRHYARDSVGLDYGAGTGPVISRVLDENGYVIKQYDPYFAPNVSVLGYTYDYIVCCEVIEHFYSPKNEFIRLRNLLNAGGELICKTEPYADTIDFQQWYYKTDPTHVFFYSMATFEWIAEHVGFSQLTIDGRVIILQK